MWWLVLLGVWHSAEAAGLGGCEILDLTQALDRNSPAPALFRPFDLQYKQRGPYKALPYVEWNFFCTYEHLGTHVNAPSHLRKGGASVEALELGQLVGEACVVDVRAQVAAEADYAASRADVEAWEAAHGALGPSCVVLLNTGRSAAWPDPAAYFGTASPLDMSTYRYPGLGEDAARALSERGVRAVGVDSVAIDSSRFPAAPAQSHLLADANIPTLENLASLDELPPRGASVIAAPLKITGGSGAQARVLALGWRPGDPCAAANLRSHSPTMSPSHALPPLLALSLLLRSCFA